ncbi:hypothetical protein [Methanotorris formicicus]
MAKSINEFGNLESAVSYISKIAKYSAWQCHTKDFIQYEPLSGVLVGILSNITGLSIFTTSYLPIPYMIYCLALLCIFRILYYNNIKLISNNNLIYDILIFFILFVGIYAFICKFVIGKFYVFEYHGIFLVYVLFSYYLLLRLVVTNNKNIINKILLILILIFVANLFTHYNYPLTLTGGLLIFMIVYKILKYLNIEIINKELAASFKKIIILFIILLTLQNFYFVNLEHTKGLFETFTMLVNTLITKLVGSSSSSGVIMQKSGYIFNYQWMFVRKWWHILFVTTSVFMLLFIAVYYLKHKNLKPCSLSYFYTLIFGRDATWMYSYFTHYGGNLSFYLPNGWLLNSLIMTPILQLLNSKDKLWNKLGKVFLGLSIILTILLLLDSTFEAHFAISGSSPFPYQVRNDGVSLFNFLITNVDKPQIIVGSLESSSALYSYLAFYDLVKLEYVFPKPALGYMLIPGIKKHKSVEEIYYSMKKDKVSKFILTKYELDNGFFGGLTVAPLTKNETKKLKNILEANENIIYDSGKAKLFDFNY